MTVIHFGDVSQKCRFAGAYALGAFAFATANKGKTWIVDQTSPNGRCDVGNRYHLIGQPSGTHILSQDITGDKCVRQYVGWIATSEHTYHLSCAGFAPSGP